MKHSILLGGFGGQGVMMAGQVLSKSAAESGMFSTFYPSYGPEQRGGTANCSVVISNKEIGSPVVDVPTILVCFNDASLNRFLPTIKSGGLLIFNSSQGNPFKIPRDDIDVISVPANQLARELGNQKVMNVIILGVIIKGLSVLPYQKVEDIVLSKFPRNTTLLEMNRKALRIGYEFN